MYRVDFFFEPVHWSGQITNAEPHKCEGWDWFLQGSSTVVPCGIAYG